MTTGSAVGKSRPPGHRFFRVLFFWSWGENPSRQGGRRNGEAELEWKTASKRKRPRENFQMRTLQLKIAPRQGGRRSVEAEKFPQVGQVPTSGNWNRREDNVSDSPVR